MFSTFRFGTELRRFGRTRMSRLALVVGVCIPLLYGALYLWAFWNPTDHLDKVQVALVNQDAGATRDDTRVTAGDDLAGKLLESRALGWRRTSAVEAADGLEQGRYVAVLTIPRDFSLAVTTLGTDHPVQAPLRVTYDDAQGYTTRTILASVMREVRTAAADGVGEAAVDKLFIGFTDIHAGLVQARDGANQLGDGTHDARDGSTRLTDGASQLRDGAGTLSAKTGEAAEGAHRLHEGTALAASGSADLADGAGRLATGATQLSAGARQLADGSGQLATGADTLAGGTQKAATGASALHTGLDTLAGQTAQLPAQTRALADGSARVAAGNQQIATKVTTATTTLTTGLDEVERVTRQLPDSDPHRSEILAGISEARARAGQVRSDVTTLADGSQQVADGNRALAERTPALTNGIATAAAKSGELSSGLGTLATGSSTLATKSHELARGAGTLAEKTGQLSDGAATLSSGATQLAAGSRELDAGAARLDSGMVQLRDGASTLATKTGELRDGAARLGDGIARIDDGTHELAGRLGEAVGQVPNLSASERQANASAISAPVSLDQAWNHKALSQGEGFAPYFIGLALYVGAMILWMLLRPLSNRTLAAPVPAVRVVLANWLPAVVLGVAQAMLLLGVLVGALGMRPAHVLATLGFILLVSLAYVSLQQTFNIVFGSSVGRVVTLVVLTMQITSSGGTYPAETTPAFFQTLHRALPLTQVVNGLRGSITGDLNHQFWAAVAYLLVLTGASLAVSTWAAVRKRVWSMSRLHPAISL
ncbi:YhgE/Pip family protein [Mariniluteicoccus flavus]